MRFLLLLVLVLGIASAQIPGLAAVDVTMNMENAGFECSGVQSMGDEAFWDCTDTTTMYDYNVETWGAGATSIRLVETTALNFSSQPNSEIILPLMRYIASLPYDGATPEDAQAWVIANIDNHEATATFGGVTYTMFANVERARVLRIEVP